MSLVIVKRPVCTLNVKIRNVYSIQNVTMQLWIINHFCIVLEIIFDSFWGGRCIWKGPFRYPEMYMGEHVLLNWKYFHKSCFGHNAATCFITNLWTTAHFLCNFLISFSFLLFITLLLYSIIIMSKQRLCSVFPASVFFSSFVFSFRLKNITKLCD